MTVTDYTRFPEPELLAPGGSVVSLRPHALPFDDTARPTAPSQARSLRRLLVTVDVVALLLSWPVALVAPGSSSVGRAGLTQLVLATAIVGATCMFAITSQRLYRSRVCGVREIEVVRLARAAAIAAVVAYLAATHLELTAPLWRALLGGAASFVLLASFRSAFDGWLKSSRAQGRFSRPVVIVGANDEGFDLYRLLHTHPECGFRISGVVGAEDELRRWSNGVPWLGEIGTTVDAVRTSGATGVVVAASAMPPAELNRLCRELTRAGVHVHLSSGLRGIAHRRVRALPLAYEPLFYLEPLELSGWQLAAKRLLDVAVASFLLALSAPALLVAALAIKLEDGGPILFRQERVGRGGRPFRVLKLRTMIPDAERHLGWVEGRNERNGGPLFKLKTDPRRTKVGRLLELMSIDELPQLINVLRGDMSLVGPRPALASEVANFDDELLARLSVPPGITGLWQVAARDNPAFYAYRRLDLFYVENWSVSLDIAIMLATVRAIGMRLFGRR